MELRDLQVKGTIGVATGEGIDDFWAENLQAGKLNISLGAGEDYAVLYEFSGLKGKPAAELNLDMGAGHDEVDLYFARVKKMNVSLGSGNDTMYAGKIEAATALFDGGLGNDYIVIEDSKFQQLTAKMGDGLDLLYFDNTAVTKKLNLDGGTGMNALYSAGLQQPSKEKDVLITNFTIL